jgi:hypothetical protein
MRRLCLVVSLVASLVALFAAERLAGAGACLTQACTCDDDCNGLVCSADGRCCGPPVTGTPCKRDGGAGAGGGGAGGGGTTGSGGTGSDGGTPPSSGGGCDAVGAAGSGGGAGLAASLLMLGAARRRTPRRR